MAAPPVSSLEKARQSFHFAPWDRRSGLGCPLGIVHNFPKDRYRRVRTTSGGIDEADLANGKISWLSPVARALMKGHVGDVIEFRTSSGPETVEVLSIAYRTGDQSP
jgi:hypothetical protein